MCFESYDVRIWFIKSSDQRKNERDFYRSLNTFYR